MKVKVWILTLSLALSISLSGQEGLSEGDKVPGFKAVADDGTVWDVSNYIGKSYVVVYFYPAAMTGGCTRQACSYRDHRDELQDAGVTVIGISGDRVENLRLFKQARDSQSENDD